MAVSLSSLFPFINPVSLAINEVRNEFKGEADRLGLKDEQDVVKMVKEVKVERNKNENF